VILEGLIKKFLTRHDKKTVQAVPPPPPDHIYVLATDFMKTEWYKFQDGALLGLGQQVLNDFMTNREISADELRGQLSVIDRIRRLPGRVADEAEKKVARSDAENQQREPGPVQRRGK
jgi:hypothetical protein